MQIIYIAALAGFVFYLQRRIYLRFWDKNLNIHLAFDKTHVEEEETFVLEEVVENDKWLPLPMLYLKYKLSRAIHFKEEHNISGDDSTTRNELWNVLMKQRITRRLEGTCSRRGKYSIGMVDVHAKGLFMDIEYMKALTFDSMLTVYPRRVNMRQFELMLQSLWGENIVADSLIDDPFLMRGIREYQTYDSPKNINWTATARTCAMKVNLLEQTTDCKAYVFLNLEKENLSVHNDVLEESIRLAKTFCYQCSKREIASALFTNGTDGRSSELLCIRECQVGTEYLSKVDETLLHIQFEETKGSYLYEESWKQSDFLECYAADMQRLARTGMVILISSNQNEKMQSFLLELKRQGGSFLWVVPVSHMMEYRQMPQLLDRTYVWGMNYEVKKV